MPIYFGFHCVFVFDLCEDALSPVLSLTVNVYVRPNKALHNGIQLQSSIVRTYCVV